MHQYTDILIERRRRKFLVMNREQELVTYWVIQKCLALRESLLLENDETTQKMIRHLDDIISSLKLRFGDNKEKIEYLLKI